MLTISGLKKFYFVPDINDMRCGAHRLLQIVKHKHHLQTNNGDVFIFMSKNQRTVKMVNFEENAYYVHQKTFANGYTFMKLKFVEDKPVYSIDWKDLVSHKHSYLLSKQRRLLLCKLYLQRGLRTDSSCRLSQQV